MTTISDRIKEGLALRNMKQIDLVEKTGIGKSSISTYISGAYEPKQKNIYKIAKALDVDEAWLMGADVPICGKRSSALTSIPFFQNADSFLHTSFTQPCVDKLTVTTNFEQDGCYFAIRVSDEAMEPYFLNNDILIVHQQENAENNDYILAKLHDSKVICRKFFKHDSGISLIALNPKYAPFFFPSPEIPSNSFTIVGKVVELQRKL